MSLVIPYIYHNCMTMSPTGMPAVNVGMMPMTGYPNLSAYTPPYYGGTYIPTAAAYNPPMYYPNGMGYLSPVVEMAPAPMVPPASMNRVTRYYVVTSNPANTVDSFHPRTQASASIQPSSTEANPLMRYYQTPPYYSGLKESSPSSLPISQIVRPSTVPAAHTNAMNDEPRLSSHFESPQQQFERPYVSIGSFDMFPR